MEVIIALDFYYQNDILHFVDQFDQPLFVKIGMEAIYANGFELINLLKARGHKVFLDLKLHDIPNTVAAASKSLSQYNIDMLTVHTQGGVEMMKAAKENLEDVTVLGVTILTSIDQETLNNDLANPSDLNTVVQTLATKAKAANLNGVVCSVGEVKQIKEALGEDFYCITPGIRSEVTSEDQKRVFTPKQAKEAGSDYIVVGREITKSQDPVASYKKILEEINE